MKPVYRAVILVLLGGLASMPKLSTSLTMSAPTRSGTYVASAPQILRVNTPYPVSVTILASAAAVNVTATLFTNDASNITLVSNQTSISSGSTRIIMLEIPANLDGLSYALVVQGSGGGVSFINSTVVSVSQKSLSIFIQTDKPIYKPGDTVLFRVIAVHSDLTPYQDSIDVKIKDNSGNKIAQWLQQQNNTGVFSRSLKLSDQPPLGTWSITANAQGNTVSKVFNVDEYVLPKFKVTVTLPPYHLILVNRRSFQQDLICTVSAVYTYGQPVKGRSSITFTYPNMYTYDNSRKPSIVRNVELKNGAVDITLRIDDLLTLIPANSYYSDAWSQLSYQQLLVVANVNETLTGTVLSGNSTVQFTSNKYSLSFLDITPTSFKPGLNFTGFLQLKQYDGTAPAANDIGQQTISLTVTRSYTSTSTSASETSPLNLPKTSLQSFQIPSSGLLSFSLDIENNCSSLYLQAAFGDPSTNITLQAYRSLSRFNSRDSEGVQISLDSMSGAISAGDTATFTLRSSTNITRYTYQLLSKGMIIISNTVNSAASSNHAISVYFDSRMAQQMAPSGRIVAWYITALGEIVSDSLDFTVSGAFANQVSVSFNKVTAQPADVININVIADRGSYVGLLAIDQSVLLLNSGNDVTQSDVLTDLNSYSSVSVPRGPIFPMMQRGKRRRKRSLCLGCWWPHFTGGTDTTQVFNDAGVALMTNAFIYATPRVFGAAVPMEGARGAAAPPAANSPAADSPSSTPSATTVRQNFPETWIWTEVNSGPNGSVSVQATVPDTITSWVLSAFAVSPDTGLGISPTNPKVTVFKQFFISLNLPYSIVRGEEFLLSVNVFNYMTSSVQASVTLKKSTQFKVRSSNSVADNTEATLTSPKILAMDAGTVSFWIVADTLGQIQFEVVAVTLTSPVASDSVIIPLLVKPEGVPQQYSTSLFLNLSPGQSYSNQLNVSLPSTGLVPGSQYIEVTVIGDMLGQSINGLGDLIQMPYGCGEQNMLNFAPNVYVLEYLQTSDQSTMAPLMATALTYLNAGYQRELTYQRTDGSFSAFGNSDPSGSTWLSAFVVKCFHEAKDFIPIDDLMISKTLNWLILQQDFSGRFSEPPLGRVIHTDMQGGSSRGIPLTAYVLISLLENADNSVVSQRALTSARNMAVTYLESQLNTIRSDPYALSIVSFALTLANSSSAPVAYQYLNSLAINKDGMKYWRENRTNSDSSNDRRQFVFMPPYNQAPSVDIEMTSYALLNYALRKDLAGGIPIAKWLVAQRNANGGFSSTQDTVVALQALAEFTALVTGSGAAAQNLTVSLRTVANGQWYDFQTITSKNALVLQTYEIPSTATTVSVKASGSGVGLVQMNVRYNVDASVLAASNNVQLTANTALLTSNDAIQLGACASWTGQSLSGMAMIEVGLPSGYSGDASGMLGGSVQRIDLEQDKLVFYVNQLNSSKTCVRVNLTQANVVDNVQPALVKAYLYYDKLQTRSVYYAVNEVGATSGWCDYCPKCCAGGRSGTWSTSSVSLNQAMLVIGMGLISLRMGAVLW